MEHIYRDDISYIVLSPSGKKRYDWVGKRIGRYHPVSLKGKRGIIEAFSGKEICPPICKTLPNLFELFRFSIIRFEVEEGWGVMNSRGKIEVKPNYSGAWILEKGENHTAIVELISYESKKALYFPLSGVLTKAKFTGFKFYEKYIETTSNDGNGILFYDGFELFEPCYNEVRPIFDGSSIFVASKKGKKILNERHWSGPSTPADTFYPPINGRIRAVNGTRMAYLDTYTGANVTKFIFIDGTDYTSQRYAKVELPQNNWYFIDYNGKEIK